MVKDVGMAIEGGDLTGTFFAFYKEDSLRKLSRRKSYIRR